MTPSALRRRMQELHFDAERSAVEEYFMVLTPLGLSHTRQLQRVLAQHDIALSGRAEISDWPATSTLLYLEALDERHLAKPLAFEALWRRLFPGVAAEYWRLKDRAAYERLVSIKREIRTHFPKLSTEIEICGEMKLASLHAFHVPDPDRVIQDAAKLKVSNCTSSSRGDGNAVCFQHEGSLSQRTAPH